MCRRTLTQCIAMADPPGVVEPAETTRVGSKGVGGIREHIDEAHSMVATTIALTGTTTTTTRRGHRVEKVLTQSFLMLIVGGL